MNIQYLEEIQKFLVKKYQANQVFSDGPGIRMASAFLGTTRKY